MCNPALLKKRKRDYIPMKCASRLYELFSEIFFPSCAFHSSSSLQPPFVSSVLILTYLPSSRKARLLFAYFFRYFLLLSEPSIELELLLRTAAWT
jgi:hypothetical protein